MYIRTIFKSALGEQKLGTKDVLQMMLQKDLLVNVNVILEKFKLVSLHNASATLPVGLGKEQKFDTKSEDRRVKVRDFVRLYS